MDPNNIENRYDNDFSRHVKRMNVLEEQRESERQASQHSDERRKWLDANPHRDHEGFAGFLAVIVAGTVGWWDYSSHFALEWWGHALLIGGTFFAVNWFFQKNRWLTKTLWFVIAGIIILWIIGVIMNN